MYFPDLTWSPHLGHHALLFIVTNYPVLPPCLSLNMPSLAVFPRGLRRNTFQQDVKLTGLNKDMHPLWFPCFFGGQDDGDLPDLGRLPSRVAEVENV